MPVRRKDDDTTYLTAVGRAKLEEKAAWLRDTRLPELREVLMDPERDPTVEADYERAYEDLAHLEVLLETSRPMDDLPDDPVVVELGDLVRLQYEDGSVERFILVEPEEAPVDDERISITSPLALAILTHRVGDSVPVKGPRGSYTVQVLSASRAPEGE